MSAKNPWEDFNDRADELDGLVYDLSQVCDGEEVVAPAYVAAALAKIATKHNELQAAGRCMADALREQGNE